MQQRIGAAHVQGNMRGEQLVEKGHWSLLQDHQKGDRNAYNHDHANRFNSNYSILIQFGF